MKRALFYLFLLMTVISIANAGFYLNVIGDELELYTDTEIARYDIGIKVVEGDIELSAANLEFNDEFNWDFPAIIVYDTPTEIRITASQFFTPMKYTGLLCSGITYWGSFGMENPTRVEIIDYMQIPEPATMVLLGLGGLMLRQRIR